MKKIISVIILTIMLSIIGFTSIAEVANAEDNTWGEFLNGSTTEWAKEMANSIYSGKVAQIDGASSYRIELRDTDTIVNGSKRSEIAAREADKAAGDYIYNFSIFLPEGGSEDYALDPEGSEIIAQWHNTPDPGEEWTCPPVAIHTGAFQNSPDHYTLSVGYDAGELSTNSTMTHKSFDLGSFTQDKGKWVDWKVHVKWGWEASQKPILQIYKDGSQIFESTQPNTTNDQQGVKMKLGVYKWDWAQGQNNTSILNNRIIYYNNVSIEEIVEEPVVEEPVVEEPVVEELVVEEPVVEEPVVEEPVVEEPVVEEPVVEEPVVEEPVVEEPVVEEPVVEEPVVEEPVVEEPVVEEPVVAPEIKIASI